MDGVKRRRLTNAELEVVILVLHYAQGCQIYPWSSEDGKNMASALKKLQGKD